MTSANRWLWSVAMIKSEQEARELLGPHVDRLRQCLAEAVSEYFTGSGYAAVRLTHTKRTTASTIHDMAWAKLRAEFDDESSVRLVDRRGRRTLHFADDFVMRVKKLDPNLRPRNIVTQLVLDFLGQAHQRHLPGLEPPTNVDLVYQLTGLAQIDPVIYIRCPRGRRDFYWLWELPEPTPIALGGDTADTDPADGASERRVRPRLPHVAEEPDEGVQDGSASG